MAYENLLTSLENGIFTITINQPKKLNALSKGVFDDLELAVKEVYENEKITGAIITGSGDKAFVAGADISEFAGLDVEQGKKLASRGQNVFNAIENAPKPFIAAVNGFALGGGLELAMSCHFRIAAANAKMGLPEVTLGLIPGYGGTQRLAQLVGKGNAMEMITTAEMINANRAKELGLVNEVVEHDAQRK